MSIFHPNSAPKRLQSPERLDVLPEIQADAAKRLSEVDYLRLSTHAQDNLKEEPIIEVEAHSNVAPVVPLREAAVVEAPEMIEKDAPAEPTPISAASGVDEIRKAIRELAA